MLGHFVYHAEVGAIEGNINPQKKKEEGVAHMEQLYIQYTLSVYIWHCPSKFLSFLCFRASIQSPLLLVPGVTLQCWMGAGQRAPQGPEAPPRHHMLRVSVQSLHSFVRSI